MTEVRLSGSIPVTVVVQVDEDDRNGHVSQVLAYDSEFDYEVCEGLQVTTDDHKWGGEIVQLAVEVAEASVWPAWEWA